MNEKVKTPVKSANRKVYNWSFKPVPQKELKANMWPFKCIRDEGKATKMECRSMSKLKESFEGTPYNSNECGRVLSRYGALLKIFKEKYGASLSKITHLLITFDSIYFMKESDGIIQGGNYGSMLCSPASLNRLAMGVDISLKLTETCISETFNRYKKMPREDIGAQLKNLVGVYVNSRKNMLFIDSNKCLIDAFKLTDYSFPSLKYLVFIPTPMNAIDYKVCLSESMASRGLANEFETLSNSRQGDKRIVPSLNEEVEAFLQFSTSNVQQYLKGIRRIFKYNYNGVMSKENIKEIFKQVGDLSNKTGLVYESPLSENEKAEINKKIEELKKQSGETDIIEKKSVFMSEMNEISGLINRITDILEKGLIYHEATNVAEKSIWTYNFLIPKIQSGIQNEYDFKNREVKLQDILAIKPFISLVSELNTDVEVPVEIRNLKLFLDILPTYFKDDRKTVSSMNIGFKDITTTENTLKSVKKLKRQILDLFEVFIGIQYGILGIYMKRFGKSGMQLAIKLMPTIQNKERPLLYSKNVLDIAERYFYTSFEVSLDKNDSNYYDSEQGRIIISGFESFCKKSIDMINAVENTVPLTHTDKENPKEQLMEKVHNLFKQYECVVFMYEQYKVFFHL